MPFKTSQSQKILLFCTSLGHSQDFDQALQYGTAEQKLGQMGDNEYKSKNILHTSQSKTKVACFVIWWLKGIITEVHYQFCGLKRYLKNKHITYQSYESVRFCVQYSTDNFLLSPCTMNIFGSKSGHLSKSNNWKIFLHFLKKLFQYLSIFQKQRVPNVLQNSEK